jgi:signal peptide peptidase SppA
MSYPLIAAKVLKSFWAITPEKHQAILSVLQARFSGQLPGEPPDDDTPTEPGYFETNSTAVIRMDGILGKHISGLEMSSGGCSMDRVASMLKVADASPRISTIVLAVNSPGGTVTGTPELAALVADIRKRKNMVAFTDTEACSGALWIASQCGDFYCTESAEVGSVGVRMILLDETAWLENEGIKVNAISSGKYKLAGASFKPLTADEREIFQAESDRIFAEFQTAVKAVRTVGDAWLEGQVVRGRQAVEIGFCNGMVKDLDSLLEGLAG